MASKTRGRPNHTTATHTAGAGETPPNATSVVEQGAEVDEAPPVGSAPSVSEPPVEQTRSTAGHPQAAADQATRRNSTEVWLPLVGTVKLPAPEELAFLGGVGVLAVVGAIEWPVAVVLGAGHALATNRRNKVVREFGEALEEA